MVSRALVNGSDYTIWRESIDRPMLIQARQTGKIKCHCGKPLTFVDAITITPHFRHLRGNCRIIGAERDTESHNEGLEYLGQLLRENFGDAATVEKERTFAAPDGLRRTDVFAAFRDGRTICYELQLSRISERDFDSREAAYEFLGHKLVWIFGPECSGIKTPPRTKSLLNGALIPLRSVVFNNLLDTGYLLLYFPQLRERLRIAYCCDGRIDGTRKVRFRRGGEIEFQVSMAEVQLAALMPEFSEGLPYVSQFRDLAGRLEDALALNLARAIYAREFSRIEISAPVKTIEPARSKGRKKQISKLARTKASKSAIVSVAKIFCSLCKSGIETQHYHKCPECGRIFDDSCTTMIERELGQKGHNMTGWVEHCKWQKLRLGRP